MALRRGILLGRKRLVSVPRGQCWVEKELGQRLEVRMEATEEEEGESPEQNWEGTASIEGGLLFPLFLEEKGK